MRASPANRVRSARGGLPARHAAMTLLELLAVMTIIAIMVVAVIGMAGYAQRRSAQGRALAEIRALELAIEDYKADTGAYPSSAVIRFTASYEAERTNSALLYQQLVAGAKQYYTPSPQQIQKVANLTFFADPYGIPYDYYRPGGNASAWAVSAVATNQYVSGGQHNLTTFDLASHGSDHHPYVDGFPAYCSPNVGWSSMFCPATGVDDITNWAP